jgi:hypothetical protein
VSPTIVNRLRGLLKLVGVIVAAVAVGAGVGLGLSKLNGSGGTGAPLPATGTTTATAATTTAPAPGATETAATETAPSTTGTETTAQTATPLQGASVPRVQVISATLFPAASANGIARKRARVSVVVKVTNRNTTVLTPPNPLLLTGQDRIPVDPRAAQIADPLIQPIAASKSATAELRFEIAGAITQRLNSKPRARLAIVNRIVALKITVSPTPAPPG